MFICITSRHDRKSIAFDPLQNLTTESSRKAQHTNTNTDNTLWKPSAFHLSNKTVSETLIYRIQWIEFKQCSMPLAHSLSVNDRSEYHQSGCFAGVFPPRGLTISEICHRESSLR